jgi:hypothetical protein
VNVGTRRERGKEGRGMMCDFVDLQRENEGTREVRSWGRVD